MYKAIQYILICVAMGIFISTAPAQDAFDKAVAQIKDLEAKLEQNRERVEQKTVEFRISITRPLAKMPLNNGKGSTWHKTQRLFSIESKVVGCQSKNGLRICQDDTTRNVFHRLGGYGSWVICFDIHMHTL